jgi:hypothetical protein
MTTESITPLQAALNPKYEPVSSPSNNNTNIGAEFQQVLSTLIMSQFANPLSSSDDSSSSSGADSLNSLMTLMMSQLNGSGSGITQLIDQMNSGSNPYGLSNQMSSANSAYGLLNQFNTSQVSLAQAQGLQINQFAADKEMGGDGINSNCGPTSLAMALRGLGLSFTGETDNTSSGELVDLTRRMMVSDSSRDGVDSRGNRADGELNYYTDFDDLARGVQAAGGSSQMIGEDAASIRSALLSGARVVISGTFAGKSPLPWTGDRGPDNHSAPGGATKHIVTVSGYDSQTNSFIINDPARLTPLRVSSASLENFMDGNAGAMAIRRR